jgi:hypothetical protein
VEGSQSRTQKDQLSCTIGLGSTMGLDSSGRSDGERGMAGANALGQRGSNVWPTICSRLTKPRTEMLSQLSIRVKLANRKW